MSVNKVILVGNVGKDPETRHMDGGLVVSRFSLATSETYKNRNGERVTNTEWHNIVLWRGLAEVAEKYVRKGTQLYIEGRIRNRSYTDKDGITRYTNEIVADNMQMLSRRSDQPDSAAPESQNSSGTENKGSYSGNPEENSPDNPPRENNPSVDNQNGSGDANMDLSDSSDGSDLPF